MGVSKQYKQQIIDIIKQLPEKKLAEVVDFVKFLKEKHQPDKKGKVVKLGGLWKGFEPTDKDIQKTRKEMWQHIERKEIL